MSPNNNGNEVNPQFKHAIFNKHLISYMEQVADPYLDNVTDEPDDISSGSDDEEDCPMAIR